MNATALKTIGHFIKKSFFAQQKSKLSWNASSNQLSSHRQVNLSHQQFTIAANSQASIVGAPFSGMPMGKIHDNVPVLRKIYPAAYIYFFARHRQTDGRMYGFLGVCVCVQALLAMLFGRRSDVGTAMPSSSHKCCV